ncbi:MAG: helix-turn-helix domain-containing protein [Actinomycetes bacterium]
MITAGPTVVRRQLGRRLRHWRGQSRMTVDQVVAVRHLGISRAKLFKLEAGKHPAKPQDIAVLCGHYGVSPAETMALQKLALATQDPSWWHVYGDDAVPEWFSHYVDLEAAATTIRRYESDAVTGLLQTREYAWAVFRAYRPDAEDAEIERLVAVRMGRQMIFERVEPPALHVVLNEAVLRRTVGGAEAMQAQLDKLRAMAERPSITLDVLPLRTGAHAGMAGSFARLDFADPGEDPPVAYIESSISAAYLQKPEQLEHYDAIFRNILTQTIPIQEYES